MLAITVNVHLSKVPATIVNSARILIYAKLAILRLGTKNCPLKTTTTITR